MTRRFDEPELIVATHNEGKRGEFDALFRQAGLNIRISSAADYGLESPPETGTTFIENALLKARYVTERTGKPALADDSGICVDALAGAPGVYTADWGEEQGNGRDYPYLMKKINDQVGDNPDRSAQFVSVLALTWPDGHYEIFEGIAPGTLVWPTRGAAGHGADPMFMPEGHTRTYAEMPESEKNAISHRARSFKLLMDRCFR